MTFGIILNVIIIGSYTTAVTHEHTIVLSIDVHRH